MIGQKIEINGVKYTYAKWDERGDSPCYSCALASVKHNDNCMNVDCGYISQISAIINLKIDLRDAINTRSHRREYSEVRMITAYLLKLRGLTTIEVASIMKRERTSIIYIYKTCKDLVNIQNARILQLIDIYKIDCAGLF